MCFSTAIYGVCSKSREASTIFLWSVAAAILFSAAGFRGARTRVVLVRLLFEGGVYFHGETADSNDGWSKHMRAIQPSLRDAGSSSTCSLSVLLSTMVTSFRTRTALEIAQWASAAIISTRVRAQRKPAAAVIQDRRLFRAELPIVRLYLRAASNQRNTVCWLLAHTKLPFQREDGDRAVIRRVKSSWATRFYSC